MKSSTAESARGAFDRYWGSPEARLLLAACRAAMGATAQDGPGGKGVDENVFRALCAEHRLTLPVHRFWVRARAGDFSEESVTWFKTETRRQGLHQISLAASVFALNGLLEKASVPHAFLKGPPLGEDLFGNEPLRVCGDLDILIAPRDFRKADAALRAAGYRRRLSRWRAALPLPAGLTYRKDAAYSGPRGERLELHWRTDMVECLPGGLKGAPTRAALLHGRPIPVLDDARNAAYLCLHAAKHHWLQLRWLLDIPLFLRARGIDARALLREAKALGLERPVREALHLAELLLEVPAPPEARLSPREAERLARRFLLARFGASKRDTFRLTLERARLYPGFSRKALFLAIVLVDQAALRLGNVPEAELAP